MRRIVKNDGSSPTNVQPKGTTEYKTEKGKRMQYTSLGDGNWEGREIKKPKMAIVKQAPYFDSKKRKVIKRKYAGTTAQ